MTICETPYNRVIVFYIAKNVFLRYEVRVHSHFAKDFGRKSMFALFRGTVKYITVKYT